MKTAAHIFSSYCSNLYLCSLWANYRKSSMSRFIVSYNNAFRILHNICDVVLVLCLPMLSLTVVLRVLGKVFSV